MLFFSPLLDNSTIENQDGLDQLTFDVQLAYAFQDVGKSHNPMRKKIT